MPTGYNTLTPSFEQRRPYSEADFTRFSPGFKRPEAPEAPAPVENFSVNHHLHVAAETQQALEHARPAGDTFMVPEGIENQRAYVEAIAPEHTTQRPERYANAVEERAEVINSGNAVMTMRDYELAG